MLNAEKIYDYKALMQIQLYLESTMYTALLCMGVCVVGVQVKREERKEREKKRGRSKDDDG